MTALLSVQQLAISTAQETLVESLSFELHAHQALTILGETGSGKSLLANAIIGNLPAGLRSKVRLRYLANINISELKQNVKRYGENNLPSCPKSLGMHSTQSCARANKWRRCIAW